MKPELTAALIGSVILAIGTTLWTWWPHKTEAAKEAEKTGQLLTLESKRVAPEDITSLRVASWDTESKDSKVFEVARKDNVWVIPTKYDYPADGGSRVGKTAGGVLNVPRGPLVTNDPKFFADLGVVDPLKEGTADPEGRGKRVTLKDASGAVVVDLIVGKKAEKADVSYVREASNNDVYTAKVDVDISTSFKDWVETDLLKIVSGDIRMIGVRDYSIDMDTHAFKERASTTFMRPKDKNEWACDKTPADKVVNQDTIGKLLSEATALRLADVHPFVDDMLDDCGILRTREGAVFGKEGMMVLGAKDGLRYHLFFGTIAVTDEAKASGKDKDTAKGDAADPSKPKNRYMAVLPAYDPAFDEDKPAMPEVKTGEKPGEKESEGQKRALKAQKRFFKYIYIISDETFKKLRPEVDTLFKSKDSKDNLPGEKVPKELNLEKSSSGLEYADLKKGEGDEAGEGDDVEVHYTGWLEKDGTKFDSSVDRKEPFPFSIGKGQVIKGWDEGVKGMKVGGKRKLVIPSDLGYGPNGSQPKIPGGATLVFDVELLKVTKKPGGKTEAPKPVEEPKKSEAPAKTEEKKPDEAKKTEAPPEANKSEAPAEEKSKTPNAVKNAE